VRTLHYLALTHPRVAPALAGQARATLGAFSRYLAQAVRSARERQFRYQLPWEPARREHTLRLFPLVTRLRVVRPPETWRIVDPSPELRPDSAQELMVVNRGATVSVREWRRVGSDLELVPEAGLEPGDQVFWCGVHCRLEAPDGAGPPAEVRDARDRLLPARLVEDGAGGRAWVLEVDGEPAEGPLRIDGREAEADRLPAFSGLTRLWDEEGGELRGSGPVARTEVLPKGKTLRGDNGWRFGWRREGGKRRGTWIQLRLPERISAQDFVDPRAAFCEGQVRKVWSQPRHSREAEIEVRRVDRERYQLELNRPPPEGTDLFLPVDVRHLELQRRALNQLDAAPLPHHRGLLRLCEAPDRVRWPRVVPERLAEEDWLLLTDASRDGTDQQRDFVERALAAPDLVMLEGPPGSGKTTAICELVLQLVRRGLRVLVCSNTNVAVDNVLERLVRHPEPVEAVRLGLPDSVDEAVEEQRYDRCVERLVQTWQDLPHLGGHGDLRELAERVVAASADVVCATVAGVVHYPPLKRAHQPDDRDWRRTQPWAEPVVRAPLFDVLVVDEASKTLIQEFLVPALLARRWVVVGDVRQLPPFTDRDHVVANLRALTDRRGRLLFPEDHQRARLLRRVLGAPHRRRTGARWLVVERTAVLERLERELAAEDVDLDVVRLERRRGPRSAVRRVTLAELRQGAPGALALAGAEWVLVAEDLLAEAAPHLPGNLLLHRALRGRARLLGDGHRLLFRQRAWLASLPHGGRLRAPSKGRGRGVETLAGLQESVRETLDRRDWAGEVTWRLTRIHELRRSRGSRERDRLRREVAELLPRRVEIGPRVEEVQDIGLPSILEVVQEGIGEERAGRRSALTVGLAVENADALSERFVSLHWQHRMVSGISSFPREVVYRDREALLDANTIAERDRRVRWSFGRELLGLPRVWWDVRGAERGGVNLAEVRALGELLDHFRRWAERRGAPPAATHPAGRWQVACLCFYVRQEKAIREMLRRWSRLDRRTRFELPRLEVVCGTVDRFQGREADLVLLSMRNTGRVGFLDSPGRLNVAVTRARHQLVVVGDRRHFARCRVAELEALARRTRPAPARPAGHGRAA